MTTKRWTQVALLVLCVAVAVTAYTCYRRWESDEPRRQAIAFAERFEDAVSNSDRALRDFVIMPGAYASRTHQEQEDFLRKALRDEISAEGLAEFKRVGKYGSLLEVFPENGPKWAKQFGADPAHCVAFKAEVSGLQAELVLVKTNAFFRVVRCNNVAQLANSQ